MLTPTPAPAPTADPGQLPVGPGPCGLPASNPANPVCVMDPARLTSEVEQAITAATQERPEYFDFNDKKCDNCYRITNLNGYLTEVMHQLAAAGVCAYWDGEEVAVKSSNAFSEQWKVHTSSGYVRRAPGAYLGDCKPAIF